MSEILRSNFRNKRVERVLGDPEFAGVNNWYNEQLKNFGEMVGKRAPLTDGKNWKKELTQDGEVENVDGSFFILQGETITKLDKDGKFLSTWTQPKLSQKEKVIVIPSAEGDEEIRISGFVGIAMNGHKILLTLAQEPFSHTSKKVLIRTPFQASVTKLQDLIDGKRESDPQLFDLTASLVPGKSPTEIIRLGELETFPLPYADANRIEASNLGFTVHLRDSEIIKKLENNGKNKWCTLQEVVALTRVGLLNGHTAAAVLASI